MTMILEWNYHNQNLDHWNSTMYMYYVCPATTHHQKGMALLA